MEDEPGRLARGAKFRVTTALAKRRTVFSEHVGQVIVLGLERRAYFNALMWRSAGDWEMYKLYKADAALIERVQDGWETPEGLRDMLAGVAGTPTPDLEAERMWLGEGKALRTSYIVVTCPSPQRTRRQRKQSWTKMALSRLRPRRHPCE